MVNCHLKRSSLTVIFLILCLIGRYHTLTICPTATWQKNATTIAGIDIGISGSDSSSLDFPTDVYTDNQSNIYVLDANNYRVQYFPSNSSIGTTIINSSYGTQLNQFDFMYEMNMDSNGSIYILDGNNGRVMKWMQGSSAGTIVAGGNGVGSNISQIDGAWGMFIDWSTSAIWIADSNNHRIVKWTSPTTSVLVCGSYGSNSSQLAYPSGIFVDTSDSNTLYIADGSNHRIQMWLTGATSGTTVAGITSYYGNGLNQLYYPKTLVVDNNKNMFIVDRYNNRILQWRVGASAGVVIAGDLTSGAQSNQLNNPFNVNFDSSGSLYVADANNNRIQRFLVSCPSASNTSTTTASSLTTTTTTTGVLSNTGCSMSNWLRNATTIAGSSIGLSGTSSTYLNTPYDVFIYNSSAFYVLDSGNYRVQRFMLNSNIGITIINGSSGSMLNQFSIMSSISVDHNDSIYILDSGNQRVTKWTVGAVNGSIVAGGNGRGSNVSQLANPYGMFVEMNTSIIWIADTFNSRIVRWTTPSDANVVCGSYGTGANQLMYPFGLFVNTSGSTMFYVADTLNHRIQMWLLGGTNGTTVAGQTGICDSGLNQLCYPTSVVGDRNGNIFICDSSNNRIMRWIIGSTSGIIVAGSSSYGVLPSQLNSPFNVKLDGNGALIVADTSNNRIQIFSIPCVSSMVSKTGTTSAVYVTLALFALMIVCNGY